MCVSCLGVCLDSVLKKDLSLLKGCSLDMFECFPCCVEIGFDVLKWVGVVDLGGERDGADTGCVETFEITLPCANFRLCFEELY